jgi:NB-ARC domain
MTVPDSGHWAGNDRTLVRRPHIWGAVPPRNADFVGREELLKELHRRLLEPDAVLPETLHGVAGVGKTQLAVEYLHRHASEYEIVWWIPAEHPSTIRSSLLELGERLDITMAETDTAVSTVLEALRGHRWILVFDNAERPDIISSFLPAPTGHVVVTSRNAQWTGVARPLEVEGKPLRMSVFNESDQEPAERLTPAIGVVVDTVGYGGKPLGAQRDVQERLPRIMRGVLTDISIPYDGLPFATSGDGMYVFLPAETDPTRALPGLLNATATRLADDNERYRDQIRLRMAVGFGLVGHGQNGLIGNLVIQVKRLVDSPPIRDAVRDHPKSELVVLVSQELHGLVSSSAKVLAHYGLTKVEVAMKEYAGAAWLWTSPHR